MPRENRKRGKKHKKSAEEPQQEHVQYEQPVEEAEEQAGPSWIVAGPASASFNEEAPFGYVDSEVKAYFRTVDVQIREWQDEPHQPVETDEGDPNEDRKLFFVAAMTEMSDKEKELATDPDCSTILERMAYSMDDFARRVFMDRLTGSYRVLAKHRFASHVCQTFLEVADETISRETRGILPSTAESSDEGVLPTMTEMVSDICHELMDNFTDLLMDPFASHVCRALLLLLMPTLFPSERRSSALRSKRSAAYKARQGPMKSLFGSEDGARGGRVVPPKFRELAEQFVNTVREKFGANEVRALAASQVASPVLQMLLEVEAELGRMSEPDSLADRVLDGLSSRIAEDPSQYPEASDYVSTLLRDATSSHLLETLARHLPDDTFKGLWSVYFKGTLARLAAHPVANFVVGKALERVDEEQLGEACEELVPAAEKLFKTARTGLVRAMIDRAGELKSDLAPSVIKIVTAGVELSDDPDDGVKLLVPCVLRLLSPKDLEKAKASQKRKDENADSAKYGPGKRTQHKPSEDPMAPKTQGALILQSMLRLPSPHNQVVLDSIFTMPMEDLIVMAHDVTGSRVLDVVLTSPTVAFKDRRKFVTHFIGHYHELVDDRIGSRVGDNCWAFADPYLREKIARSLIPHEMALVGSFYGKFFARNLNLYLLQRNPEQWKTAQAAQKAASKPPTTTGAKKTPQAEKSTPTVQSDELKPAASEHEHKKKRKARPDDEIERVFETLGKKVRRAELKTGDADVAAKVEAVEEGKKEEEKKKKKKRRDAEGTEDRGLEDVLGAIKAAPKDERKHKHKKKA